MGKRHLYDFNYKKVARYDTIMWQSYYNRHFFRLFWQLLQLVRSQLGFNWPLTIRLAYYAGWAAADFRINRKRGINKARVLQSLDSFYKIISSHSHPFDYKKAAQLELEWWQVHRDSTKNNPALEQSLARAAAVVYRVQPDELKDYAHYRAEAMILPHHEADSPGNKVDWPEVHRLLLKSWQALFDAVHNKNT